MEKAKGTALGDVWYQLPSSSKHKYIRQVVELEAKLVLVALPRTRMHILHTRSAHSIFEKSTPAVWRRSEEVLHRASGRPCLLV
jgi:hypothetical protein